MPRSELAQAIVLAIAIVLATGLAGCGLQERADLLVGRECDPNLPDACDPVQVCLPHGWISGPTDFLCRDSASFDAVGGVEPPLAYCNDEYICPTDIDCAADRVRQRPDGIRRRVCQRPGSPFAPP